MGQNNYDRAATEVSITETEAQTGYVRLKIKTVRGSGVRDTEEITGELVAPDLDEFKREVGGFRDALRAEAEYWREFDPERDEHDEHDEHDESGDNKGADR